MERLRAQEKNRAGHKSSSRVIIPIPHYKILFVKFRCYFIHFRQRQGEGYEETDPFKTGRFK